MKTRDDNLQHDLTHAYCIGAMTEEEVREVIEEIRAEFETVPVGLQHSPVKNDQEAA